MGKYMLFIGIVSFFLCCKEGSGPLERKIILNAELCKNQADCTIDLKKVRSFEWDSLYVFYEYDDRDYISEVIGFQYNEGQVSDGKMRMIFVKGKSVIYEEEFGGLPYKEAHINISMPVDRNSYSASKGAFTKTLLSISARDAKFHVQKIFGEKNEKDYYYLNPLTNIGYKIITPA